MNHTTQWDLLKDCIIYLLIFQNVAFKTLQEIRVGAHTHTYIYILYFNNSLE